MTHRREALTILIFFFFLGVALLSAGCTRPPVSEKPSVSVPVETTADLVADNRQTIPTPPDNLMNPDVSVPGISTVPERNVCDTSGNNQSTCPPPTAMETRNPPTGTQIPDPAVVYCMAMNNSLEIRKNPDGSEYTFCILAGGTTCDVWDYYQGLCPSIITPEAGTGYTGVAAAGSDIQDLASGFCTAMKNRVETWQNPDGTTSVLCILPDGTECDVTEYYEGTCPVVSAPEQTPADETFVNPSEAFCRGNNLTYNIRLDDDGIEYGICIFADGKECDAWEYYVGACSEETATKP